MGLLDRLCRVPRAGPALDVRARQAGYVPAADVADRLAQALRGNDRETKLTAAARGFAEGTRAVADLADGQVRDVGQQIGDAGRHLADGVPTDGREQLLDILDDLAGPERPGVRHVLDASAGLPQPFVELLSEQARRDLGIDRGPNPELLRSHEPPSWGVLRGDLDDTSELGMSRRRTRLGCSPRLSEPLVPWTFAHPTSIGVMARDVEALCVGCAVRRGQGLAQPGRDRQAPCGGAEGNGSMSEQSTQPVTSVAIDRIVAADGFNPRRQLPHDAEFAQLVSTIGRHGVLQPVRVRPDERDGDFVIVAGHRRVAAAREAGLTDIPVVLTNAGADPDSQDGALVQALIENDVRVDLDPVDRAHAYQRLRDGGLTVKGIAQTVGRTQRAVRGTLQVLDLPEPVTIRVGSGEVPLKAVKALAALAKADPDLAELAVQRTLGATDADLEPLTWDEVIDDPVAILTGRFDHYAGDLPAHVAETGHPVALDGLALSDKACEDLERLAVLLGRPIDALRLSRTEIDAADRLGALLRPNDDWAPALIVGIDVVAQLVGDVIARELKTQRKLDRERKQQARQARENADETSTSAGDGPTPEVESDEQRQEREQADRRVAREAEQAGRQAARTFNERLGVAVVNELARVKVDERVLRILTSINLGPRVGDLAMRGARYGLPGWVAEDDRGKVRYLDSTEALTKAHEFLDGARGPGDVAGRTLVLLVMATFADENCVAMSNRVGHTFRPAGMPWADDVDGLLDELIADKLPTELVGDQLAARATDRQAATREARERAEARARVSDGLQQLTDLEAPTIEALIADVDRAFAPYDPAAYEARRLLREALDSEPAVPSG